MIMMTPISYLERVKKYCEQKLNNKLKLKANKRKSVMKFTWP